MEKPQLPEEARELFAKAQDLTEGAENFRTLGHLKNLEDETLNQESNNEFKKAHFLETESEEISMKAHEIAKDNQKTNTQLKKENIQYDTEIKKLKKQREYKGRLDQLKDVRNYLAGQNMKKGIDDPLAQEEDHVLENIPRMTINSQPVFAKAEISEVPEEVFETGLSSPAELEKSLQNINDETILEQNKETRIEAIADLQNHLQNAKQKGNIRQIAAFEEMIKEQNVALDVIAKRHMHITSQIKTSGPRKWFSRFFGRNSNRDAA